MAKDNIQRIRDMKDLLFGMGPFEFLRVVENACLERARVCARSEFPEQTALWENAAEVVGTAKYEAVR